MARTEVDDIKRVKLMEEAFLRIMYDVPSIPLAFPNSLTYWQPWVNNCYGEMRYTNDWPDTQNWWLDLDMKAEMGY